MCGRYGFVPPANFKDRFELENELDDLRARYNVAPGSIMPIVTRNSPNKVGLMKWGLIPFWSKDPKIAYSTINARSETVETSPAFRKPFKSQRCLVPVSFFYEWKRIDKKTKTPYLFKLANDNVFSFAGLYDIWKDAEEKEFKTYTIITTTPNKLMEPVHNRMPVILSKEDEEVWLNIETDVKTLHSLLDPYEENYMTDYIVSSDVNRPINDTPQLINPVT
ncbi:MAG: SOS response-associated peptidase [Candidatus Woykebacteria bacterium]